MKHLITLLSCLLSFLFSIAQNSIAVENSLPGNPISEWGVPDFRDNRIAGFTTKISVNSGQTIRFKIDVQGGTDFTMKIYRIGYYAGNGARLMADLGLISGLSQAAGISDPSTGILDCGNWSESAHWDVPSSAVSGLYVAKIERIEGGSNHIVFIVRNDNSHSDMYFQIPDATWQAYNGYGGNSNYDGNTSYPNGHAVKVSYNRPFFPYNSLFNTDGRGSNWYMNAEYPMIRWLERNGYDVTYTSCNDVANHGARLLNHKVLIFVAHDEYWSKEQRENVEAARDAGVHLSFFTGNEVYWKVRWENNNGSEDRTMVCYKEGLMGNGSLGERACGSKCDVSSNIWTGLWRTGGDYDAGRPENGLTGQISWTETPDDAIQVPSYYKKLRFWRNTTIPSMSTGQTTALGSRTLGYEWDYEQYTHSYPKGRITMSSTTLNGFTHKISLYRHSSGALVFGAGTVQWSWGLDGKHLGGTNEINKNMQQSTLNLFADMGVQPTTMQSNLVAASPSTDFIAPTSTITSPSNGASFPARSPVTISGTATDASVVAGIEVSVDGGTTWNPATTVSALDGTVTWTYTWAPSAPGTINVKSRGYDDSGNIENAGTGIILNITTPGYPFTIFEATDVPDKEFEDSPMELGVRFKANTNGYITGVRFYKGTNNGGTHIGNLWTEAGVSLAQVTFTNETGTGWQQADFATPVAVTSGTTYVASYYNPTGNFSVTKNFFMQDYPAGPTSSWPAQALSNSSGGNGVFNYSSGTSFPGSGGNASNYYVDIVFTNTIAVAATLTGSVLLQGRPAAPSVKWQVPVHVDFFAAGNNVTPAYSYDVTTDQNGIFTINNVPLGTYTITVKNSHTLKRVKTSQSITGGNNSINFGTLLEGDASNNNFVSGGDLIQLLSCYNKASTDPSFIVNADLNGDGFVSGADLILILSNYNSAGENP
ncbi:MAG: N,N-dimethylformamidase beta subunit family domain-containing protein [Chitinophagaceae bacterium]